MRTLLALTLASLATACAATHTPAASTPAPAPAPVAVLPAAAPAHAPTVDEMKDVVVTALDASDGDAVYARLDSAMARLLPADQAGVFASGVHERYGRFLATKREPAPAGDHQAVYILVGEKTSARLELGVDATGKITTLRVQDPPRPAPPVARTSIPIAPPFRGAWDVLWGGDTPETNYHVVNPQQRRAADLARVGDDGKTFRGDGTRNTDYLAYGQEILAAADGVVTQVVDGIADNVPGAMNAYFVPGNLVVIRHTPALYSAYAHLVPGSARVKVGDKVKLGTALGRCGNSGNSSEPHLHFQLEDAAPFTTGFGVEALFHDVPVTREGKTQAMHDYTFLKGDRVEGQPPKSR
jgi:murein DD-endopeptidase MepM/ murein hydrolase activator NlpD